MEFSGFLKTEDRPDRARHSVIARIFPGVGADLKR